MPGITGYPNPSYKFISGYLNGEDLANLGTPLPNQSGTIVSAYGGFLGGKATFSVDDALKMSNPATGILYGGVYQCVKTNAAAANLVRGRLVFWDTTVADDLYQVHQLETLNGSNPLIAGVLLNTVTPGNYTWIQVAGKATVQCRATVTAATRNISASLAGAGVDNATVDGIAAATAVLQSSLNASIGIGEAVAANAALILVNLKPLMVRI